ncbi:YoaK family protein [Flavobacterium johnsoniae]|uniref:YoaK family protein n=1 Tax=Flavobacterium johnsoniae TaxID=986 RepID=UPI003D95DF94
MFVHQGRKRTSRHNLQIASLLSFVAGMVNVAGFLAAATLTTNVTGHFAFFVDEIFKLNFWKGLIYFLYIFFFFLGSFFSSFLVELLSRKNENHLYILPVSIESLILFLIAVFGDSLIPCNTKLIACSLLFAMGLQNSLVTRISSAAVRTTHLTGLFTDLGIELSQLFFYREALKEKLLFSIKLRLTIISFFFAGGVTGGVLYSKIGLTALLPAALLLIFGIIYDTVKLKLRLIRRKYRN